MTLAEMQHTMSDWSTGKPWRMIHTNLREIDMLYIDTERYVADLRPFRATVVLLNSAGRIASYPTALPYHFQSPYLQGSSLTEIIEACHAAGNRVLARSDLSRVRRPICEQHPEWAYISPQAQIVDHNVDVHVCLNSACQQHFALEIVKELVATRDLDGVFFNMTSYQVRDHSGTHYGICQCANCRARFAAMYGLALPTVEDVCDPVYRRCVLFVRQTLAEHQARV